MREDALYRLDNEGDVASPALIYYPDIIRENTRRFIRKLKVLELKIENRDYDFLSMVSEIEQYCHKNQVSYRTAQHIQLAFEETVQNLLLPVLSDPVIHTVIEYSAADESTIMTMLYNGGLYDVTKEGDALSLAVLESAVSEITWSGDKGTELCNKVEMKIKQ